MSRKDQIVGISLRLRDAHRDVGALLADWGLVVGRAWVAGTPRETPRGNPLEGVYADSYAYARLPILDDSDLSDCLVSILDDMASYAESLVEFVDSGGFAELFVQWHFESNSGDVLDWKLLERLASHRLSLSLDIYPEQRTGSEETDDEA